MSGDDLDKAFDAFSKATSMPGGPSPAMQRHGPTWEAWKKLCDAFADRRKPIQLHGRDAEIMLESIKRDLAQVEPHTYVPSTMHMGDCAVCGHLQGSPLHSPFRVKERAQIGRLL